VIRAIVERGADPDDRVARDDPLMHGLDDSLLHRRDEVPRHGAADDLVDELEGLAVLHRLEPHVDVPELAASSGLLLVPPLLAHRFPDGLPVRNAGLGGLDMHAEAAGQLLQHDLDLQVANAREDSLVELARHAHVDRGILLAQLVEAGAHLLLALRLREIATSCSALGNGIDARMTEWLLSQSVWPV
jgi:hypothetical protein